MKLIKILLFLLIIFASSSQSSFASFAASTFFEFGEGWNVSIGGTQTNNGWIINDAACLNRNYQFINAVGAAWLINDGNYSDSFIRSPILPEGGSVLSFVARNKDIATADLTIQKSSNGSSWTTFTNIASTSQTIWVEYNVTLPADTNIYIKIIKQDETVSGTRVGIDDIEISHPPAKVYFGTPYTEPSSPLVNEEVRIFCTITTNSQSLISSASLVYNIAGTLYTNSMTETTTQNLYQADSLIPGIPLSGSTVSYDVIAAFTGTNAVSPASVSSFYKIGSIPLISDYNSMQFIGGASDAMTLVSNNLWRGIASINAPGGASFEFKGTHTNGTTNFWGDTSPNSTSLIAYGTAVLSQGAFNVDSMPNNDYVFLFNESDLSYVVNSANFNDFDEWTGATSVDNYTKDGWVVNDGWIEDDIDRRRGTRSCYLSTNGNSYVRSPEIIDGIGQISFWLRSWETNTPPAAACYVQVSETGGTNNNEWTTISTNIVSYTDFNRFTIPRNNRYNRYVRIKNSSTAPKSRLAIDEFLIAGAGAGVTMSNMTHSPAIPTLDETVSISVDISEHRGAEISGLTAHWSSKGNPTFSTQSMTNTSGNTWVTEADIPAGQGDSGDGLGSGTVEYFVSATFSGYDNHSPTFTPEGGISDPSYYEIESAQMTYSNVHHTPSFPEINSSFIVKAEIIPSGKAINPEAEVFYRVGESGNFTSLVMNQNGNYFESYIGIPTSAHPGTPVYYYIVTTFQGPSADSPVTYPSGGPSSPISVISRAITPESNYTNMVVEGDFNGTLSLVDNNQWSGIITSGLQTDPEFIFKGTSSSNTTFWGDNDTTAGVLPLFSTAVINESNISLSGTYSNYFMIHFNENDGKYRMHNCYHEDYSSFSLSASPSSATNANGWNISTATVFDSNDSFDGNTCGIGGSTANAESCSGSLEIDGGFGNISFWYRNLDETGTLPGNIHIETRSNGGEWNQIDSIENILSPNYIFHEKTYGFQQDNAEVRIVWYNDENLEDANIAIDNFAIEHLGTYTTFSNLTLDPISPDIGDEVTVEIDISPLNQAINITAKTWFRIGTNGNFTAIPMFNSSGDTFETSPPIPHTEPGIVQYYVESEFTTPLGGNSIYAYYPAGGPHSPLSYSNTDAFAASVYFDEVGWYVSIGNTQTNNGWIISDTECLNRNHDLINAVGAAWLINDGTFSNSFIQSPLLLVGGGVLSFEAANLDIDLVNLSIEISYNGETWFPYTTVANQSTNDWIKHNVLFNTEDSIFIKISKEETDTGTRVGIDDIEITYPVADIVISNVYFSPLYPADNENVNISCDILSVTDFAPAIDITARVFYKLTTETNYTAQPVEMTPIGNNYVTLSGIPTQPAGSTIDYYIESTFKGYSRSITNSPKYSPTDGQYSTSPYSYEVRAHQSSYSNIIMNTSYGEVDMKQVSDENWIGVLNYTVSTNDTPVEFWGKNYYDGTNLFPGTATIWGDASQTRTTLPYVGQMTMGESNLVLKGDVSGQYILDFNEVTGEYILRHGVYQDFNDWPSDPVFFEDSLGVPNVNEYSEDFDNSTKWPVTTFLSKPEDVEDPNWINIDHYPPIASDTFGDIIPTNITTYQAFDNALVITQIVGKAIMLGELGYVQINPGRPNDGIKDFEFDFRCVDYDEVSPATYTLAVHPASLMVEARVNATKLPNNSNKDSQGYAYVSVMGHYISENEYYELRYARYNETQYILEIWKCLGGNLSMLSASAPITGQITSLRTITLLIYVSGSNVQLRGYLNGKAKTVLYTDSSSAITDAGAIALSGMDTDFAVDHVKIYKITTNKYKTNDKIYENFFTTDVNNWVYGSSWTRSNGFFLRDGYTGTMSFNIDTMVSGGSWTNFATYNGYKNSDYVRFTQKIERPETMFVRVRQASGSTGNLVLDNFDSDYWHAKDFSQANGWVGNEVCINNGASPVLEMRTSKALTTEDQYIRSPLMTKGAGIIEFKYKTATTTSNECVFSIEYTLKDLTNDWKTLITVTNTSADWKALSEPLPTGADNNDYPMFMQILNISTNWDSGILIDNISITEPIPFDDNAWRGYNTLVTGEQDSRLLVEPNNIKGGYINNAPDIDTDGETYPEQPYIETALIPYGVGEVSFWYRAWNSTTSRIDIIASNDRTLPEHQWNHLQSINNITNQNFAYFSNSFYEPEYKYLRLRVPTDIPSMGRVCVENLQITEPFGSLVYIRNMTLIPELPLYNDEVRIQAEVYDTFYSPSNVFLRAVFTTEDDRWGEYSDVEERLMGLVSTEGNVKTYQTIDPFKAGGHAIDTVVQYYVRADFEGFFSNKSSPVRHKEFTNPAWYWPVDLNTNQANQTPYYVVFSCLPGQVWINELNISDDIFGSVIVTQFVELCGSDSVDISNWKVQVINTDYTTNTQYTIDDSVTLSGNDYGFFMLGDSNMTSADLTLTNTLPPSGGIKLLRSMGAEEDAVSYDSGGPGAGAQMAEDTDHRFVYAGAEQIVFAANPLSLYGLDGSNKNDFAWAVDNSFTPGDINDGQTLVPWGSLSELYAGTLVIESFSTTNNTINMVVAGQTNDVVMTPWYTTNIVTGPWVQGVNKGQSLISGTNYNVWCNLYTNTPGCFYKVTSP